MFLGPALPAKMFLTDLSVFIKRIILLIHSWLIETQPLASVSTPTEAQGWDSSAFCMALVTAPSFL